MREAHYSQDGELISNILLPKTNECEFVTLSKNITDDYITVENIETAYSFNKQTVKTIDFYYDATAEYPDTNIMLRAGIGTEKCPLGLKDFDARGYLPENLRCAINTYCQCSGVYVRLFCRGKLPQVISGFDEGLLIVVPWENQIFYIESDTEIRGSFVGAKIEVADAVDFFSVGFVDCEVSIHSKNQVTIRGCAYNSSFLGIEQSTESEVYYTGGSASAFANCSFSNIDTVEVWWGHSIEVECSHAFIGYCVDSTLVSNDHTNGYLWVDVEYTGINDGSGVNTAYNCVFNYSIDRTIGSLLGHSSYVNCTFNIDFNMTITPDKYSSAYFNLVVLYAGGSSNCEFNLSGKIDFAKGGNEYTAELYCFEYTEVDADTTVTFDVDVTMPEDDRTYDVFEKRIRICTDANSNSTCHRCLAYRRQYQSITKSTTNCSEV